MKVFLDLIDLFCGLVTIPSESGEEGEFIDFIRRMIEEEFSASSQNDAFGNLILRIPGKHSLRSTPLLFGMHADTVSPGRGIVPVVENGVVRSDGTTILGADDKAGIAEFIIALRRARNRPPIELVLTREEERGLVGSRNLDYSLIKSKEGFVLDMDNPSSIVIGGPTKINLDISIQGKAAHAGMEPEKGISAIKAAAMAIALLPDGRVDAGTTCNIGTIIGGENRNSVPEKALLQVEVRSLDHEKAVGLEQRFRKTFQDAAASIGADANIVSTVSYRATTIAEDSGVVLAAASALRKAGLEPLCQAIVGGTDASIYNEHGIACVVLDMGARKEHTKEEHIFVAEMEQCVAIIETLLEDYAENPD